MPNNTGLMTKDNMVELKPCPFCGGGATVSILDNAEVAECIKCGASVRGSFEAWNTRATMHGSDSGVTEAMIEAGQRAWLNAGGHNCDSGDLVGPIYLAMLSASPPVDKLREALAKIADRCAKLREGTDDWFELIEIEGVARAALNTEAR